MPMWGKKLMDAHASCWNAQPAPDVAIADVDGFSIFPFFKAAQRLLPVGTLRLNGIVLRHVPPLLLVCKLERVTQAGIAGNMI
jgi:hypothetical protein